MRYVPLVFLIVLTGVGVGVALQSGEAFAWIWLAVAAGMTLHTAHLLFKGAPIWGRALRHEGFKVKRASGGLTARKGDLQLTISSGFYAPDQSTQIEQNTVTVEFTHPPAFHTSVPWDKALPPPLVSRLHAVEVSITAARLRLYTEATLDDGLASAIVAAAEGLAEALRVTPATRPALLLAAVRRGHGDSLARLAREHPGSAALAEALESAASSGDPSVQLAVARIRGAEALAAFARDTTLSKALRTQALAELGQRDGTQALEVAIDLRDAGLDVAVAQILGPLQRPEDRDWMLRAARGEQLEVAEAATRAIGTWADAEANLLDLLQTGWPALAAKELAREGTLTALPALRQLSELPEAAAAVQQIVARSGVDHGGLAVVDGGGGLAVVED